MYSRYGTFNETKPVKSEHQTTPPTLAYAYAFISNLSNGRVNTFIYFLNFFNKSVKVYILKNIFFTTNIQEEIKRSYNATY